MPSTVGRSPPLVPRPLNRSRAGGPAYCRRHRTCDQILPASPPERPACSGCPGRVSSCRASKLAVIAVDCESMVKEPGRTSISSFSQASWRVTSTVAVEPTPTNTGREIVLNPSRDKSSVYRRVEPRETISALVVSQRRARAHQRAAGDLDATPVRTAPVRSETTPSTAPDIVPTVWPVASVGGSHTAAATTKVRILRRPIRSRKAARLARFGGGRNLSGFCLEALLRVAHGTRSGAAGARRTALPHSGTIPLAGRPGQVGRNHVQPISPSRRRDVILHRLAAVRHGATVDEVCPRIARLSSRNADHCHGARSAGDCRRPRASIAVRAICL